MTPLLDSYFAGLFLSLAAIAIICPTVAYCLVVDDRERAGLDAKGHTVEFDPTDLPAEGYLLPLEVVMPELADRRVTPTDLWQAYLPHHSAEPVIYECSGPWTGELERFRDDLLAVPA